MRKLFLSAFFLGLTLNASAQTPKLHEVFTVSGGIFGSPGNKVTLHSYSPVAKETEVRKAVPGDFTNDAYMNGELLYYNVGPTLYEYGIWGKFTDSVDAPGLQRIATAPANHIVVTQGFGTTDSFLSIYERTENGLQYIKSISEVNQPAKPIAISGRLAFIGLTGAYPDYTDTGIIMVVDVLSQSHIRTIKLDTLLKRVDALYKKDNMLYAVSAGYISVYNLDNDTFHSYSAAGVWDAFALNGNLLYVLVGDGIATWDITTHTLSNTIINASPIRAALDTLNDHIYFTESDYFTYGLLKSADAATGQILDTDSIGIAPEAIALSYASTVGIGKQAPQAGFQLYPQPAQDVLNIDMKQDKALQLQVLDVSGRILIQKSLNNESQISLTVSELPAGAYLLRIQTNQGTGTTRFIKL